MSVRCPVAGSRGSVLASPAVSALDRDPAGTEAPGSSAVFGGPQRPQGLLLHEQGPGPRGVCSRSSTRVAREPRARGRLLLSAVGAVSKSRESLELCRKHTLRAAHAQVCVMSPKSLSLSSPGPTPSSRLSPGRQPACHSQVCDSGRGTGDRGGRGRPGCQNGWVVTVGELRSVSRVRKTVQ